MSCFCLLALFHSFWIDFRSTLVRFTSVQFQCWFVLFNLSIILSPSDYLFSLSVSWLIMLLLLEPIGFQFVVVVISFLVVVAFIIIERSTRKMLSFPIKFIIIKRETNSTNGKYWRDFTVKWAKVEVINFGVFLVTLLVLLVLAPVLYIESF